MRPIVGSKQRKLFPMFLLLALATLSGIVSAAIPGVNIVIPSPLAAHGAGPTSVLGINCAYGAMSTPGSPITTRDNNGTVMSNCQWAGDTDSDGVSPLPESGFDPLVTDPVPLLPPAPCNTLPSEPTEPPVCGSPGGGGFVADVVITSVTNITAFDVSVFFNPKILEAVLIDQSGIEFSGGNGLTLASTIDNVNGTVHLSQALLGTAALASSYATLFRIRFNVVGAGTSQLLLGGVDKVLGTRLGLQVQIPHTIVQGSFSTNSLYDLINGCPTGPCTTAGLGFNASFTISPSNPLPFQQITLQATAACSNCTGTLTYYWSYNSTESSTYTFTSNATGPSVTVTPPPGVVNRITLVVKDHAIPIPNNVTATRILPFEGGIVGPSTATVGSPSSPFSAGWIGGVAPYSGSWKFCPSVAVCSSPTITISSSTPDPVIRSVTYNFAGVYSSTLTITNTPRSWLIQPSSQTQSVQVNVTGTPYAFTVSLTPNSTETILGQAVSFNTNVTYASTYPTGSQRATQFNYTIYYGDGTSDTNLAGLAGLPFTHNYAAAGTFNVLVTAQERRTASQILESQTIQYRVVSSGLSSSIVLSQTTPTVGQLITLTGTGSGGAAPYGYSWTFGDGTSATGSQVTHTYNTAGSYNVTLTITDSTGTTVQKTQLVTVATQQTPPPQLPILYILIGVVVVAIVGSVLLLRRKRKQLPTGLPNRTTQ